MHLIAVRLRRAFQQVGGLRRACLLVSLVGAIAAVWYISKLSSDLAFDEQRDEQNEAAGADAASEKSVSVNSALYPGSATEVSSIEKMPMLFRDSQRKQHVWLTEQLYNKVRIICWIMTSPSNADRRAAIRETWGKRCQRVFFVIGLAQPPNETFRKAADGSSPFEPANVTVLENDATTNSSRKFLTLQFKFHDTYESLWQKTKEAFAYIAANHLQEADWFYKADDDVFALMDNLRLFLSTKNPADPLYYGCKYRQASNDTADFHSGGPGYVLSRETLRKFVGALKAGSCDNSNSGKEDVKVAECLRKIGILAGDTIDSFGRLRFFPFDPIELIDQTLMPARHSWFWNLTAYTLKQGFECCSDTAIAFHYISPAFMRTLEYLVYYLPAFGGRTSLEMSRKIRSPPMKSEQ